jgi:hypothetical protein
MKILLTTKEGYSKDRTPQNKKRFMKDEQFLVFNGDDAPIKAVKALCEKYGIKPEHITKS